MNAIMAVTLPSSSFDGGFVQIFVFLYKILDLMGAVALIGLERVSGVIISNEESHFYQVVLVLPMARTCTKYDI